MIRARAGILALFAATITMAVSSSSSDERVRGCTSIVLSLQPCLGFIKGDVPKPSEGCCKGAKDVDDQTKTSKDRQDACQCIKDALTPLSNINSTRIPEIPIQCNIPTTLPPINSTFKCSELPY